MPRQARMTHNILEYQWSSAKDYVNECSDIVTDRFINKILSLFKDKNEFIRFHNLDDGNL